jgi:replicative DNA helicase
MEMSTDELTDRLAAAAASVPGKRLSHGRASNEDQAQLLALSDTQSARNLFWTDRTDLSVDDIAAMARGLVARERHALGLVVVDYIQLLRPAVRRQQNNRTNDVSEMSRGLKILAGQLDCPVIALSQLSRASEQRPNKRPMNSDLRESGSLEQDANIVLLLHRDDVYNPEAPPGIADLIVSKNRSGSTGEVKLLLEDTYPRFGPAPGTPGHGAIPTPDVSR